MSDKAELEIVIATLRLDEASFAWLDGLRRAHFPPERNQLSAHLTLFHRISPAQAERVGDVARHHAPLPLTFSRVRSLGGGVAIDVESVELHRLRAELMQEMGGLFTRQDQQGFRPHVTIQNKVTADTAKALVISLGETFVIRRGFGTGLLLWTYLGGPWKTRQYLAFDNPKR